MGFRTRRSILRAQPLGRHVGGGRSHRSPPLGTDPVGTALRHTNSSGRTHPHPDEQRVAHSSGRRAVDSMRRRDRCAQICSQSKFFVLVWRLFRWNDWPCSSAVRSCMRRKRGSHVTCQKKKRDKGSRTRSLWFPTGHHAQEEQGQQQQQQQQQQRQDARTDGAAGPDRRGQRRIRDSEHRQHQQQISLVLYHRVTVDLLSADGLNGCHPALLFHFVALLIVSSSPGT